MFDADGRADFEEGIHLARKKGFGAAFSNMCIEYWFMLHFYDHDGSEMPTKGDSHSATQIKKINEFIMLAIDSANGKRRIVTAFERAKAIHEDKKAKGVESAESVTTIYELLLRLGVIEKTAHGFKLYEK